MDTAEELFTLDGQASNTLERVFYGMPVDSVAGRLSPTLDWSMDALDEFDVAHMHLPSSAEAKRNEEEERVLSALDRPVASETEQERLQNVLGRRTQSQRQVDAPSDQPAKQQHMSPYPFPETGEAHELPTTASLHSDSDDTLGEHVLSTRTSVVPGDYSRVVDAAERATPVSGFATPSSHTCDTPAIRDTRSLMEFRESIHRDAHKMTMNQLMHRAYEFRRSWTAAHPVESAIELAHMQALMSHAREMWSPYQSRAIRRIPRGPTYQNMTWTPQLLMSLYMQCFYAGTDFLTSSEIPPELFHHAFLLNDADNVGVEVTHDKIRRFLHRRVAVWNERNHLRTYQNAVRFFQTLQRRHHVNPAQMTRSEWFRMSAFYDVCVMCSDRPDRQYSYRSGARRLLPVHWLELWKEYVRGSQS